MKVEFCLPVYNEAAILKDNVLRLLGFVKQQNFSFDWQIVLIVNGSSKEFEDLAKGISNDFDSLIKTVIYAEKGKGRAIKNYALVSTADVFVYMDADLAVALTDLPSLVTPLLNNEADLVMGSRLLKGSKKERSFFREFSSLIYIWLSKIILRHSFSDLQCGFKAINLQKFKQIVPLIKDNQWFFDTELIYLFQKNNWRIKEIPVDWSENRYQARRSKIKVFKDGWSFLKKLVELRVRK
ncbi:MAG: hypothetical protein US58_C0012G0025 [Candidatus Magasanikbacteria bacterium GW2011_GWA2_37_8]|uniref:Glycosyltransferase 2-like domain-containing protein n=1 Tax=Candidatus Magasanikbacteria bacterium GW2011_GWA2_37_8 TaxID=1619036 RepID=A0A0G0KJP6_9BACT|nr:MAG: hypothetical protein US58_C0012G0025 [Candidatus Magasanikbacteria bacterium GW2011_GWA2_37_8]